MTDAAPSTVLAQLQQWVQAAVMRQVSPTPEEAAFLIAPSRALSSTERLEIYARAYSSRLIECLKSQFPVLARATGEAFDRLAAGYLARHPSRSYTLNRLGEEFSGYLEATRPPTPDGETWPDALIDLARLEWEFDQVFDGPGIEGQALLSAEQLTAIAADRWAEARLVPAPCLRLLAFRFPVHDYYRALRHGEPVPLPAPAPTLLAVTRRDYVVRYFPLSRQQHRVLDDLLRGATIGDAVQAAAAECADLDHLAGQLRAWFGLWTTEGFFLRVEAGGRAA